MPRPLEFDRAHAVNRALALFWRQGCQATTLAGLLQAMDIGRSSFYAAFTDKRTFFIECLDLWAARTLDLLERARVQMPPIDALQDFFQRSFVAAPRAKGHWGCMLVPFNEGIRVSSRRRLPAAQHLQTIDTTFRLVRDAIA